MLRLIGRHPLLGMLAGAGVLAMGLGLRATLLAVIGAALIVAGGVGVVARPGRRGGERR